MPATSTTTATRISIITELTGEGSNLYVNDGAGKFRDTSAASGLGAISLPYTGWGTAWFDFDNDGWLDVSAANGTIVANEGEPRAPFPSDQRKVLFRNPGTGRFEDVYGEGWRGIQGVRVGPRRGVW